ARNPASGLHAQPCITRSHRVESALLPCFDLSFPPLTTHHSPLTTHHLTVSPPPLRPVGCASDPASAFRPRAACAISSAPHHVAPAGRRGRRIACCRAFPCWPCAGGARRLNAGWRAGRWLTRR